MLAFLLGLLLLIVPGTLLADTPPAGGQAAQPEKQPTDQPVPPEKKPADPPVPPEKKPADPPAAEKPPEEITLLEGQITDAMGMGMKDVEVVVRRKPVDGSEGELIARVKTNETGDYQVKTREKITGKITVSINRETYEPIVHELNMDEVDELQFLADELRGNLRLTGKVVDAVTLKPIAKAEIILKAAFRDWNATAGEDGTFEIKGLAPGKGILIVDAEKYGREVSPVAEIKDAEGVTVSLKPERVVTIDVLDDLEKPIKGVTVEAFDEDREDFRVSVTDDAGRIVLRRLHFDTAGLQLRLTHDEHVCTNEFSESLSLPTDKPESQHKLVMRRAGRVEGEVVDAASGRPLSGARVVLGPEPSDFAPRAFTLDDGKYVIRGAPPGPCVLTVHRSGFAPDTAEVQVETGKAAGKNFKLTKGVLLKGVVRLENGDPAKGAFLEAGAWRGRQTLGLRSMADDEGEFELDDAPADEFELIAMLGRSAVARKKVSPGTEATVELVLPAVAPEGPPAPSVTLKVGDAAPDFSLTGPDGKTIQLADFKGKTVLLTFWATWCPPCVAEVPTVVAAHSKFGARKDVAFLNLSLDMEKKAAEEFIAKKKMAWQHAIGEAGGATKTADAYGVQYIPTNFLIGPDGKILAREMHGAEIEEKLAEFLKKDGAP